jgi:intracellular multiplication protein IcmD
MKQTLLLRGIPMMVLAPVITFASSTQSANTGIGGVATNITNQVSAVGQLIFAVATVAGVIMMAAGLFKLKQHKDNPQQIPIGTPLTMLILGACLAFLPSLVTTGGDTIFGAQSDGAKVGGYDGTGFGTAAGSSSGSGSGSG